MPPPTREPPTCASLSTRSLPLLGRLRAHSGIRLFLPPQPAGQEAERLWIYWPAEDEAVTQVVQAILGAELFCQRDGLWYRPGSHLPNFDIPSPTLDQTVSLAVLLTPTPVHPETKKIPTRAWQPVPLTLVRSENTRPATALLCSLATFERWAERATSRQLEVLNAVWDGERILVRGNPLPPLFEPDVVRYSGQQVLIPLGFRLDPPLLEDEGEEGVRELLGMRREEIVYLIPGTGTSCEVEVIPAGLFGPVTRAGVRLASGALP